MTDPADRPNPLDVQAEPLWKSDFHYWFEQEEIDAAPPGEKDLFPHPASRVLQETAQDEVETDGSEHDQDIPSLTPGVEQQARQQQQDIRQTALADESQGEHGRQEEKEKGDGGEDHGRWLSETRTEFPGRSGRMAKTAGVSGAPEARHSNPSGQPGRSCRGGHGGRPVGWPAVVVPYFLGIGEGECLGGAHGPVARSSGRWRQKMIEPQGKVRYIL